MTDNEIKYVFSCKNTQNKIDVQKMYWCPK